MGKIADIYYKTEPFAITEEGFNKDYSKVSESIFSLGNEYIGIRGYFEEGYSGESLRGSYFNGLYEQRELKKNGYKGSLEITEFMVNSVDWLYTRIYVNGNKLDLNKVNIKNFKRRLDMKTGLLCREFLWEVERSITVKVSFERFLSMSYEKNGGQRISIQAIDGNPIVEVVTGLDFDCIHESVGKCMFEVLGGESKANGCSIKAQTLNTKMEVYAEACLNAFVTNNENGTSSKLNCQPVEHDITKEKKALNFVVKELNGETITIDKMVFLCAARNSEEFKNFENEIAKGSKNLANLNYDNAFEFSKNWWETAWENSDIEIEGDDLNQQGIRFCIFQLHQTLHTAKYGAVFGAKGLTGEAYNGNTFWDSEVYCLPFYLFTNPEAAKSILKFRYDTLAEAKKRGRELDVRGAFYPIATISGKECCDLWQHANLQLQASTGVFYGIWNYLHTTGDYKFLYDYGLEMLVEISRMLASRGDYDASGKHYGYYGVMGPDEFQMMVHNNAYTNFMGKKALEYTFDMISQVKKENPDVYFRLIKDIELTDEEIADFKKKADDMYIPRDEYTGVFEQHEGYFKLPHLEIADIPIEDFPLYSHWAYDRIYRNDMLKQPDVLMFMMLYASEFTDEEIEANFNFYEPRCIHESSLSPSIHSILANRLRLNKKAEEYFAFATRMDLDNYNRNTSEGLHTTSIAGAWMNIVYGFSGFVSDGDILELTPILPSTWEGYSYSIMVKEKKLTVKIDRENVKLKYDAECPLKIKLYGKEVTVEKMERAYSYIEV